MSIRRELPGDVEAIRAVTAAAFRDAAHHAPPQEAGGDPGEATLIGWLRDDAGWIPELSLVAIEGDEVIGHVVCTRAHIGDQPALGLGPLSVIPQHQGTGVGTALMEAVLEAAESLGEPLIALLGEPAYYGRFGFSPAKAVGILPPDDGWGDYFQVRTLRGYDGEVGEFRYAAPLDRL